MWNERDTDSVFAQYVDSVVELAQWGTVDVLAHLDVTKTAHELWNDEVAEPVAGGWPVLEVDTNRPVEVSEVLAWVRRLAS